MLKFAFSADIEKMYQQILVASEDQNFQRIVWRESVIYLYKFSYTLCTVTYGTASAPFLATCCLKQIAMDFEMDHPDISSIIKNDFYVDDCLSGSGSFENAVQTVDKLSDISHKHGFHLRKWRSNFTALLEHLSSVIVPDSLEIQTDDSYSGVIYYYQLIGNEPQVNIMVAKTKDAPIKQISICRLDLLGALLLARLFAAVFKVLPDYSISFHAWTDSSVVLSWLAAHPLKWKIFVANRTSEILDIVPYEQWSHVPSKDNPADLASRGVNPEDLANSTLWWHGPSFLCMNKDHWPQQNHTEPSVDKKALSELKPKSPFNATTVLTNDVLNVLFENVSSLSKIVNIISYCFRFFFRCRQSLTSVNNVPCETLFPYLSTKEREGALQIIIIYVQSLYFQRDIELISYGEFVAAKSSISSLCPFLDEMGVLRGGGRLQNSQLSFNAKHPVITPSKHKLSELIVKQFHIMHLHAGPSLLANILKQNYWIVKGKTLFKITMRDRFFSVCHDSFKTRLDWTTLIIRRALCGAFIPVLHSSFCAVYLPSHLGVYILLCIIPPPLDNLDVLQISISLSLHSPK
ncbi:integrase catalytic domain-containing protein [Nephila pilipes]|uniref:Integrase catalytic domain-containing protein n=1 Tax=Nephila pilipes TaxID=299642 RepID=A0A8X6NE73_NEPPI|nr:integrase catalytic domain-containing protein [Nephila pilipes]